MPGAGQPRSAGPGAPQAAARGLGPAPGPWRRRLRRAGAAGGLRGGSAAGAESAAPPGGEKETPGPNRPRGRP